MSNRSTNYVVIVIDRTDGNPYDSTTLDLFRAFTLEDAERYFLGLMVANMVGGRDDWDSEQEHQAAVLDVTAHTNGLYFENGDFTAWAEPITTIVTAKRTDDGKIR